MTLFNWIILYLAVGMLIILTIVWAAKMVANGRAKSSQESRDTAERFLMTLEVQPFQVVLIFAVFWLPLIISSIGEKNDK